MDREKYLTKYLTEPENRLFFALSELLDAAEATAGDCESSDLGLSFAVSRIEQLPSDGTMPQPDLIDRVRHALSGLVADACRWRAAADVEGPQDLCICGKKWFLTGEDANREADKAIRKHHKG